MSNIQINNYAQNISRALKSYQFESAYNMATQALLIDPHDTYCISRQALAWLGCNGPNAETLKSAVLSVIEAIEKKNRALAESTALNPYEAYPVMLDGREFYNALLQDTDIVHGYLQSALSSTLLNLRGSKISDPYLDGKALFGNMTPTERIEWNRKLDYNKEIDYQILCHQNDLRDLNDFKDIIHERVNADLTDIQKLITYYYWGTHPEEHNALLNELSSLKEQSAKLSSQASALERKKDDFTSAQRLAETKRKRIQLEAAYEKLGLFQMKEKKQLKEQIISLKSEEETLSNQARNEQKPLSNQIDLIRIQRKDLESKISAIEAKLAADK